MCVLFEKTNNMFFLCRNVTMWDYSVIKIENKYRTHMGTNWYAVPLTECNNNRHRRGQGSNPVVAFAEL